MSAEQKQEAVVKPLEWEYRERPVRTYTTSDDRGLMYYINQSFGSDSYYFATVCFHGGATLYDGDDLPAAKAAAQADYERRIRSALVAPAASSQERIAQLEGELRRITDHLEEWARYHSDERTAETDAAIYCARRVIGRAALAAQPLAETGGEWKTVPFEPTEAMLSVGIGGAHGVKRRLWQLMLAAAPERIVGAAK